MLFIFILDIPNLGEKDYIFKYNLIVLNMMRNEDCAEPPRF